MPCCKVRTLWLASTLSGLLIAVTAVCAAEPERLTHDGRQKSSPIFHDAGREIVYAEFSDANLFQLRRLVIGSPQSERLHLKSTTAEFEPTWSADGECYAHLRLRGVLSVAINVRDKQGNLLHEILPGGGFVGFRSPALSPDHTRLAFSYAEGGAQQIYTSKLNGEDRRVLAQGRGISNWPHYSPDGQTIAFGSSRDGNFEIYSINADGSNLRRLTDSSQQDSRPKFSPDGKRIAFTSHRDGNAEIYVMNVDGTGQQRLTDNPDRDDYAEWHPDGRQLVVVSEQNGQHDLYLVHVPE